MSESIQGEIVSFSTELFASNKNVYVIEVLYMLFFILYDVYIYLCYIIIRCQKMLAQFTIPRFYTLVRK